MVKEEKNKKLQKNTSKRSVFLIVSTIIVLTAFGSGYFFGLQRTSFQSQPSNVDLKLFWETWNKVKEKATENVSEEKMLEGAISGMMSSLGDPYTVYFNKEENKRFKEDIQGEFGGIGIEIVQKNGFPTVVAPLAGSPAEKSGLKSGDIITEVDGQKTSDLGFEETINKIRGPKDTKVKLTINRESKAEPLTFEVTRDIIVVKSVEYRVIEKDGKKIGYIKIKQFGDDTDALFNKAALEIKKQNLSGIILDLRNNPGGYLESAVSVSSVFIEEGVVVTEKGKNLNKDYRATGGALLGQYKTVVLVNGGSASASEIVAGALKDRIGSKIVGQKTFGKGSVQELVELSDGSAAKITVAKWFTPNGTQINNEGIKPDFELENGEDINIDNQLEKAQESVLN